MSRHGLRNWPNPADGTHPYGERHASGIAGAKANGKRWGGRKNGMGLKADPNRVLELRAQGLTNHEVAAVPNVSTRTVIRLVKRAQN